MENKNKSIRIPESIYKDIREIQHERKFNTVKATVEYLVDLYKGNE